jgi:hypothetical protein
MHEMEPCCPVWPPSFSCGGRCSALRVACESLTEACPLQSAQRRATSTTQLLRWDDEQEQKRVYALHDSYDKRTPENV